MTPYVLNAVVTEVAAALRRHQQAVTPSAIEQVAFAANAVPGSPSRPDQRTIDRIGDALKQNPGTEASVDRNGNVKLFAEIKERPVERFDKASKPMPNK
jgi:hypothetical protein